MKRLLLLCALAACCTGAFAQGASAPAQNVLQLSASGVVEVSQDLLSLHLNTTREGADPALVQSQLRTALDAALNEARKSASPGQLDVRTGNFAIYPRNSRDGKLNGWQGQAELVLEGRDFARITQAAGRIQTMTLAGAGFGLSREQRAKVEGEAQAIAIERFKSRAIELAKAFGFSGYTLREVSVQDSDAGYPRPVMMRQAMAAEGAAAPIPVEAGRASVTVTVSGSVQLR